MIEKTKHIKTGVIGVGSMGKNHARILSEISNLIAVSDNDEVLAIEVSKKYGIWKLLEIS